MPFPTSLFRDPTLGATLFAITRKYLAPVNGVNTIQSSSSTLAVGCIHPATRTELELVPEEYRSRDVIVIYTPAPLSLGGEDSPNAAAPDEITWNDRVYRLIGLKDWGPMGFYQGIAVGER